MTKHLFRGVMYFDRWEDARQIRDIWREHYPDARIVAYERGYAVQLRLSGPYFPAVTRTQLIAMYGDKDGKRMHPLRRFLAEEQPRHGSRY